MDGTKAAKIGLVLAVIGMLVGIGLVIGSFVLGLATPEGAQMSRAGSTVTIGFLAVVLVLAVFLRRRTQRDRG